MQRTLNPMTFGTATYAARQIRVSKFRVGKILALKVIAFPVLAATVFLLEVSAQTGSCSDALQMFRQHRWSDAAAAFDECEQRNPGTTDALLYRGKALINLHNFDDAAGALHTYAQSHPQSDDAVYLLAYISFRNDDPTQSLRLFAEAAKLKPPSANDMTIAALDYVLLKDYTDAAHYLELSLKMNPEDSEARYHLGRVRYQQNQFDLAISAFEEVLARDPKNMKAQDNLGLSLEAKDQAEPAIAAYKKAIELDESTPMHSEQPYLNLGSLLAKSSRYEEAIPLLTKAVEIAPGQFKVHYELARAYFDSNRFEPARQQAEKAVELDPKDSSGHYLLGRIYQRLGQKDLAKKQFQTTSELLHDKDSHSPGGMATGTDSREMDSHQ
jgi:tetratricopeptide (TPR) repeat protein